MKIPFTKYQGTGNDFILIDNRNRQYDHVDVLKLCTPKFGIGADGLMLLQNIEGYDFEMVYYNSDGNISTMCGNGGRCIADFAHALGIFKDTTIFKAIDGPHDAKWYPEKVELKMQDVSTLSKDGEAFVLNTGSPHFVLFTKDIADIAIIDSARAIRYNAIYGKEGINVNFVEITNATTISVRTYERGVENETLSCGTGVTASAIALSKAMNYSDGNHTVTINTPGGQLSVKYNLQNGVYTNVWLIGAAQPVFAGTIEL